LEISIEEKATTTGSNSFLVFVNLPEVSFVDGEEGSKRGKEGVQHRVNIAGTMKIIPGTSETALPSAPQDPNS
jgi:hypothetical protein